MAAGTATLAPYRLRPPPGAARGVKRFIAVRHPLA
jgi:hypothetical protein